MLKPQTKMFHRRRIFKDEPKFECGSTVRCSNAKFLFHDRESEGQQQGQPPLDVRLGDLGVIINDKPDNNGEVVVRWNKQGITVLLNPSALSPNIKGQITQTQRNDVDTVRILFEKEGDHMAATKGLSSNTDAVLQIRKQMGYDHDNTISSTMVTTEKPAPSSEIRGRDRKPTPLEKIAGRWTMPDGKSFLDAGHSTSQHPAPILKEVSTESADNSETNTQSRSRVETQSTNHEINQNSSSFLGENVWRIISFLGLVTIAAFLMRNITSPQEKSWFAKLLS